MINLEILKGLLGTLSTIAGTTSSIKSILSSESAEMVKELAKIENTLVHGFNELENAENYQTLLKEWQPMSDSLTFIEGHYKDVLEGLKGLSKDRLKPSGWSIQIAGAEPEDFAAWCYKEVYYIKGFFAESVYDYPFQNPTGSHITIPHLFDDSFGPSTPFDTWLGIVGIAQKDDSIITKFYNQNQYTVAIQFMQEIYVMCLVLYYIHDAILKFWKEIDPSNPKLVKESFLKTERSTLEKIFGHFKLKLEVLQKSTENLVTQRNEDDYKKDNYAALYDVGPISYSLEALEAPEGSYLTSISLNHQVHYRVNCRVYIGLFTSFYNHKKNETETIANKWTGEKVPMDYFNNSFPIPPSVGKNKVSIITGIKFEKIDPVTGCGNQLCIAVRFGTMDLTDPTNPIFDSGENYTQANEDCSKSYFHVPKYLDLRGVGMYEGQTYQIVPDIMTSAAFYSTMDRLSLKGCYAAELYNLDLLNPDNWPIILETV